jgi:oxygen-dependent protoporphyrinogen oxidase
MTEVEKNRTQSTDIIEPVYEELASKFQDADEYYGPRILRVLLSGKDGGSRARFCKDGEQRSEQFDALVCAVPGSLVNDLMPRLPAEHREFFGQVEYIGHHVFHAIIDAPKEDLPPSILYPTIEGYQVISNSWLLPFREPDKAIFYGEIKGKFIREAGALGDDQFVARAWAEARRGVPSLRDCQLYHHHLQRNNIAICRHYEGYMQALADFHELPPLPHIAFAGDYLTNSTVGQAYRSGVSAAEQILSGGGAQLARAS